MILPGWQWGSLSLPASDRLELLKQDRMLALARNVVETETVRDGRSEVSVGDVVVHQLSDYEKPIIGVHPDSASGKFQAAFSGPARVVEVKDKAIIVKPLWSLGDARQVPVSQVKILPMYLPQTLKDLATKHFEIVSPLFVGRSGIRSEGGRVVDYDLGGRGSEGVDIGESSRGRRRRV